MRVSLSVGVLVERKLSESLATGREVLFVLDSDGLYKLPSGHLEDGETPRQAALREFLEETGYGVTLDGLIRVITIAPYYGHHYTSIGFIFHGRLEEQIGEPEFKLEWVNPQRFCELVAEKIGYPEFTMPAFWNRDSPAPIDVVFERPM
ncbi:MAG: NUDIX domain-containing protein [Patescibacteria group bacterium]